MPSLSNSINIGSAGRVRLAGGGGVSYDADATTLFAAMSSQPDATRKGHINTLVLALKTAGVWAKLDELWVMAAHDSQAARLGWKRLKDLTAVNSPTFETDRGYTGNGTTSYLNTNYTPSTDGVQFKLNDASLGVYSRTDANQAVGDIAVINASSQNRSQVTMRFTDGRQYGTANSTAATSVAVANALGLGGARRAASDTVQIYRNGAQIASVADTSQGLATIALYIGARNNAGTADQFTSRQYAAAFVGASMTAQQQLDLFTALEVYLDAVGAGVVA